MTQGIKECGKGDAEKLRTALLCAGFYPQSGHGMIFSDTRKYSRRLKLWLGTAIHEAPLHAQQTLERYLKQQFGNRYVGGFFTEFSGRPFGPSVKSFCVRLAKE